MHTAQRASEIENAQCKMHKGQVRLKIQNVECKMRNAKSTIVALVFLSAIILLAACGGETAAPTAPTALNATGVPRSTTAESDPIAYITNVVLAKGAQGDNYDPVDVSDTFEPSQKTLHAIVSLQAAPADAEVRAEWYLIEATGYAPNSKIDESGLSIKQGGTRNLDFTLENTQGAWPPGTYQVKIFSNGVLAVTKNFKIEASSDAPTASPSVIKQIVLAQAVKPDTFEPINPTTRFQANAPAIYTAVLIENSPPGTIYRVRWYPPGQEPLEKELSPGHSLWLESHLLPSDGGFPTGEYKVEIYMNDQLVDTKTFTVE